MFPYKPSWVCESLQGGTCSQQGAFRESSHLLLLYCWSGELNLLSAWWQIWLFCRNFIVNFASLYLYLSCLSLWTAICLGFLNLFSFFFFNLPFIASSSPRSVHFLFSEGLPLCFVTLSVVYGQRGSTPYGLFMCINKKGQEFIVSITEFLTL